jgi:hypothetical protein
MVSTLPSDQSGSCSAREDTRQARVGKQGEQAEDAMEQQEADDRAAKASEQTALESALLEKVADFYHKTLLRGRRGLQHLNRLGLADLDFLQTHHIGHCDGRLLKVLPSADPKHEQLRNMGLVDATGTRPVETFLDCIVVPLRDEQDGILALWGMHVKNDGRKSVPQDTMAFWNIKAATLYPEIVLCGDVVDALSLAKAGMPNVVGLAADGLSDPDVELLKRAGVNKVVLVAHGDVLKRLKDRFAGIDLACVTLADGDTLGGRLVKDGDVALVQFIEAETTKTAKPKTSPGKDTGNAPVPANIAGRVTVTVGNRTYTVHGIEKSVRRLKATVRAEFRGRLHVDTLDFYNARCRKTLAQDLCRLYEESAASIEADIGRIIKAIEDYEPNSAMDQTEAPQLTAEERAEAEAFGRQEDLLDRIAADYEACGLIGETSNKLIGYLAAVSRKLDDPVSILILSSSGAGKTALQDATLAFVPPEDVVKVTSLTGKALFYKGRSSLKHKVLAVEEGAGAQDASYAIRNLVSAKVLVIEAAVKDFATGRITTIENRVEGPTSVFITTTDPDVDPETRSRFLVLTVDESREQTRAILDAQRRRQTLEAVTTSESVENVLRRHRNFQRLLAPVLVVNPYAGELEYQDDRLQSRRDHPKFLNLIKALAFLRQMGRPVKTAPGRDGGQRSYIEVQRDDIATVVRLMREACGRNPDDLNGVSRALLGQICRMVDERMGKTADGAARPGKGEVLFTRREIREYTGWAHSRVKRYLKQLVEMEFLAAVSGRCGRTFQYALVPEDIRSGDLVSTWSAPGHPPESAEHVGNEGEANLVGHGRGK